MKIVLVNPGSPIRRTGGLLARFVTPIPPLGLSCLAGFLAEHGHQGIILDQYCDQQTAPELVEEILAHDPDMVGFSCLTPNMSMVHEVVDLLRVEAPDLPVVMGNAHATVFKDRLLRRGECEYVVRAEGEEPLLGLLQALAAGEEPRDVPNLSWRTADGEVVHNPDGRPTLTMDELPHPEWSSLDLQRYAYFPVVAMHEVTLPIQGSRGCAYACTFCAQDQVYQAISQRSPARICDEIEHQMAKHGVTHFGFNDAYFPLSVKKGHKFLDELERRGLHEVITWITETRVDKVDQGLLERMAADGCRLIMYGVEFGTEEMLGATNKHADLSQARKAIAWTHEVGIFTLGLFVIGMPGEDETSIRRTLAFARELNTDIAKFNIAVPLPGSQFFMDVFDGELGELDTDAFHSWYNPFATGGGLVWTPDGVSGEQLVRLQREGMLRYYLRPSFLRRTLERQGIRKRDMLKGGAYLMGDLAKIRMVRGRDTPAA